MTQVVSSISGFQVYAPSAGFAPTNYADVSAIASGYQVVSATATQLNAGTAYLTSVNDAPVSASRAGNAANASMANSAYYDGTGRLISSLPDSATVSAIASSYAESAASGKQDTLTFAYDDDKISAINGSALAGQGGVTGDYVEKSATEVAIGSANTASFTSFAQGSKNSALSNSFAQGNQNTATSNSFAQGEQNSASLYSFAQGSKNSARLYSFAQGVGNSAKNTAVVFGVYNLRGDGNISTGHSAAFVIGNGSYGARHDLMLVTHDGEITMYSSTADTVGTGIMSSIRAISAAATGGGVDSATVSAIASSYAESAASSKLDSSASSSFYTTANESGFITGMDLTDYATTAYVDSAVSGKLDSSAIGTAEWMTVPWATSISGAQISAELANFANGAESARYDSEGRALTALAAESSVSSKLDASASSSFYTTANESGFITGVDLTPYQTTAGMTAYQPAGDYQPSGDYYSASNPSGFVDSAYVDSAVSGKQDSLTFAYDADSAISAINGSALAGGGVTGDYLTAVIGSDRARLATGFQNDNNNRPSLFISAERDSARSTWPRMILTDWNRTTGLNHSGMLLADGFEFYQCPDSAYGQVSPSGIKRARLDPTNLQFLVDTAISSDNHSANYGRSGLWFFPTGGSALSISISSDTSVGPFIQLNDNSGSSGKMMVSSIGYWNNKLDSTAFNSADFYTTANESGYIGSAYAASAVSHRPAGTALPSYVPYSSLEYNTASAISGINGSALAAGSTYSAGEGIDITDDVISVEAPVDIVAGPGIVIDNPDGNTLRVSMAQNYEVTLFETTFANAVGGDVTLSENAANFDQLRITYILIGSTQSYAPLSTELVDVSTFSDGFSYFTLNQEYMENGGSNTAYFIIRTAAFGIEGNKLKFKNAVGTSDFGSKTALTSSTAKILKVVGIHRTASN